MAAPLAVAGLSAFESVEGFLSPASLLLTGVLVAIGSQLPAWLIVLVGAALGVVYGLANGLEIVDSTRSALSVLGASGAAIVIAAVGTLFAAALKGQRGRIVVRVVGSWAAAMGLMLIGLALRG